MTDLERTMAQRLRQRADKPLHEGDYWSDDEREQLKLLFDGGCGITEIALTLERSEPAVMQMIEKLDLYDRQMNPLRRKRQRCARCLCGRCEEREHCERWKM